MKVTKIETNIKRNLYFHKSNNIHFSKKPNSLENNIIDINSDIFFQDLIGFGGAFTESACYSINTVDNSLYNKILDEYFSEEGLNYNLCRLPIGSSDFSLNSYSYSKKDDLSDFSINRDLKYIIPTIKSALERNSNIQFVASPWSPPSFMKDNKNLYRGRKIIKETLFYLV